MSKIKKVERIAHLLVKESRYSSMVDFTAEDIEYIAKEAKVDFTVVVDILQAELI